MLHLRPLFRITAFLTIVSFFWEFLCVIFLFGRFNRKLFTVCGHHTRLIFSGLQSFRRPVYQNCRQNKQRRDGTFSIANRFPISSSPSTVTRSPLITAAITDVYTALWIVPSSFLPIALAITTFAPSAIPIKRFRSRPTIGLLAPTAATATVLASPVKLPTIAISDALKSYSRIPVATTGSAYLIILSHMEPCSISIFTAESFVFSK